MAIKNCLHVVLINPAGTLIHLTKDWGDAIPSGAGQSFDLVGFHETLLKKVAVDRREDFIRQHDVWTEPGCYQPTFPAPYHRVRLMADTMLTTIMSYMNSDPSKPLVTIYEQVAPRVGIETRIHAQW